MNGGSHAPKASKKEIQNRITRCLEWLGLGWTRGRIVQEGSKKWGVTVRQVDDYYAEARRAVSEGFAAETRNLVSDISQKLDLIYEKAMFGGGAKGDLNTARHVVMDKAKLAGLLKQKVDFTEMKAPDLSMYPKKELLARIRKKLRRA